MANLNSSTTIILISILTWTSTSFSHTFPNRIKSLGLDINDSFIKGLYCKSIITSVKNIFNFIKDKVKDLFNILSIRDNIIILYVKIALVKNELLKQIDEVLENYEQKLAPPLIKMDATEAFWSQFGVKFEHHKKDDVEDILDF